MIIETLQTGLFAVYGNAYLQGKDVSFDSNHPMGYNYQNIKFVSKIPGIEMLSSKDLIAKNPNDWFKYLKKNDFSRLYLSYDLSQNQRLKDHIIATNFGGGHHWHILAQKEATIDIWTNIQKSEAGENMNYYLLTNKSPIIEEVKFPTLEITKKFLKEILNDLIQFTKVNKLTNWMVVFQGAIDYLSYNKPDDFFDQSIMPPDCLSLEALQIIAACDKAWVFGGMGSWNDVVQVNDYDLYNRLTANLYDTLCKSFVAAINSYPK